MLAAILSGVMLCAIPRNWVTQSYDRIVLEYSIYLWHMATIDYVMLKLAMGLLGHPAR